MQKPEDNKKIYYFFVKGDKEKAPNYVGDIPSFLPDAKLLAGLLKAWSSLSGGFEYFHIEVTLTDDVEGWVIVKNGELQPGSYLKGICESVKKEHVEVIEALLSQIEGVAEKEIVVGLKRLKEKFEQTLSWCQMSAD